MKVIEARNVNDAWPQAIDYILSNGTRRQSRNGDVISVDVPVATVYQKPMERVLFDPVRDANPLFHLNEALWMLAGSDNAYWLDQFVGDFSKRFSEDGGRMHGAYGKRWRSWFYSTAKGTPIDQLEEAIRLLGNDPYDRQVVISMWDAESDLGVPGLKDRPCNTHIYLRADRYAPCDNGIIDGVPHYVHHLDMTVCCRSNDAVFGAYGANVVHFSVLQEYLAFRLGFEVGTYTQISNNLHIYQNSLNKVDLDSAEENRLYFTDGYIGTGKLFSSGQNSIYEEIEAYIQGKSQNGTPADVIDQCAMPMAIIASAVRQKNWSAARHAASRIVFDDWRLASERWIARRSSAFRGMGEK